jgi:hydrogenase small subunit
MDLLNKSIKKGGYFLVVEGSIPAQMPEACFVGHEPVTEQVLRASKNASAIISVGTCAAFGGIPAAMNNPTGAIGVPEFLNKQGLHKPMISLPGCPCHPDWIVGTLVHVLQFGMPEMDNNRRPKMFYNRLIHDQCPRFPDYEREVFAKSFSDKGCLFRLGCIGPNTYADCTTRYWNAGISSCIKAGAPCIGCAAKTFAQDSNFALYRKSDS